MSKMSDRGATRRALLSALRGRSHRQNGHDDHPSGPPCTQREWFSSCPSSDIASSVPRILDRCGGASGLFVRHPALCPWTLACRNRAPCPPADRWLGFDEDVVGGH